ncbi:2-deoxyribose-5-phosphate aldolase [Kocuria flava]|uniref:Deoxyribose-phosphate aldolase n=1 Tax=Kocuria flava TaxID=446860 RepID=A0A0U3HW92_9MICC|nr:deoxyribose-phosphate aldolase [Kocuria flava]ALU39663.1 2-deoxyribose-5-phosphate aldolase [Kocuria flava]GEO91744.1 deoxyribose-phosphate aldolase [Kocuria flava]
MSDAPNLAPYIDSTLLKPEASREQIAALCEEAVAHGFAAVCTNPLWTSFVRERLAGSDVRTCAVVGFPLGASATEVKAFETRTAVDAGAQEIDMVVDIAAARAGERETLERDVRAVAEAAHAGGALLKVIIETCLLDDDAKVLACEAAVAAGADFVKTSTGFSTGGATVADVRLMRATVGPDIGVKASGGIRTREDALAMIEAGATRIGASSGPALLG